MAQLPEGTKLSVGLHKVEIVKFLSEGGFSQIYEVKMDPKHDSSEVGCLKQVIVPDKAGLNTLRKEVDVMKGLRSCRNIVRYYDSNAERLADGSYQVLVLMELCPNQSLLDYMNARIRLKLAEKEILKIMLDITVGLYEMHRHKLVHRDIKIENVLIDAHHVFKLCDFGSVSAPIRPPKNQHEFQLLSHDILYQTTPQYRAPEMVDLYRGFPIDERADIWALGCFLYKLCYYTTPFEANGDIAILHALFQFLPAPEFSGDLKNLIIIMLQENPLFRPNVVQILMLLCRILNKEFADLEIEDFYNAGPYNFQALHDMQRQKHNDILKQQQFYYDQQHKQKFAAKSLLSLQTQALSNRGSQTPQPQTVQTPQPQTVQTPQLPNQQVPVESQLASQTPNQAPALAPAQIPAPAPAIADLATAKIPQSLEPQAIAEVRSSSHSIHSTTAYSQLRPQSEVFSEDNVKQEEEESDVDLEDLGNLEDAEERYPSLDALDGPNSPLIEVTTTDEPIIPKMEPQKLVPSEFESKEAWEKLTTSIDKNAEKLVEDIFDTRSAPEHEKTSQNAATGSIDITRGVSSSEIDRVKDEMEMSKDKKDYFSQFNRPVQLHNSLLASVYNQPAYLQTYVVGKVEKRESSNPWGSVLNKSNSEAQILKKSSPKFEAQKPGFDNPDLELAQRVVNLNLEDRASSRKPSAEMDQNLIDLEVGLSSSSSTTEIAPPLPQRYEEVSLLDMDLDERKQKVGEKPSFKKKLSDVQPRIAFREEVIDFASDDENTNSEMSRMAIRNSLKKSRKTSDNKRSDSSHSDSRKRLSFFGSE